MPLLSGRCSIALCALALLALTHAASPGTAHAQQAGDGSMPSDKPAPATPAQDLEDEDSDEDLSEDGDEDDDSDGDDEDDAAPLNDPGPAKKSPPATTVKASTEVKNTSAAPQETTAPADATTDAAAQEEEEEEREALDVGGPYRRLPGGIIIADQWDHKDPARRWQLAFGGYIRTQYRAIQDDPAITLLGRNDGFVLANARPYFAGRMPNGLGWRFQFDAASTINRSDATSPYRDQIVRARDAFISYQPASFFNFQVGQFKPPFNLEELQSTAELLFIDRSVGSQGVSTFAGFPVNGLALDREVGAQVTGQVFFGAEDGEREGPGVSYAVSITNGSPSQLTFNDNDQLAYHARASFHFGDYVSVGGGGYFNNRTLLIQPEPIQETILAYTADLAVNIAGVKMLAALMQQRTESQFQDDAATAPDENTTFVTARAITAQIGYEIPVVHLQPAYRIALYDPTVEYNQLDPAGERLREQDALTYHTIGLSYLAPTYPLTVMVNYTIAQEQEGAQISNNQFQGLLQLSW